jgi:MFS family permease
LIFSFSSSFGYATDICTEKKQHIQTIAIIEASLNVGVVIGYVLCTFIFEIHAKIWQILVIHVLLLVFALFISLAFLTNHSLIDTSTIPFWTKIKRPLLDIRDLFIDLKSNSLLLSFIILLLSFAFYEFFRMGSSSIFYLYLHRMSFNDTQYAAYFTCEQLGTCLTLIFLALLRQKWKINELYLCIIGSCLSLVGLILFAFANNNKTMIFGGRTRKRIIKKNIFFYKSSGSFDDVCHLFSCMFKSNYCSFSTEKREGYEDKCCCFNSKS